MTKIGIFNWLLKRKKSETEPGSRDAKKYAGYMIFNEFMGISKRAKSLSSYPVCSKWGV